MGVVGFLATLALFPVSVSTPGLYGEPSGSTVNLHRLQIQELLCIGWIGLAVAGAFIDALGNVRRQIVALGLRGTAWDDTRPDDILTTEEFIELGVTQIEGRDAYQVAGEPMQFPTLAQAVRYARERRLR